MSNLINLKIRQGKEISELELYRYCQSNITENKAELLESMIKNGYKWNEDRQSYYLQKG